jgi:hypothetical protein
MRGKARELTAQTASQVQHRRLDQGFVSLLARLEPVLPVVAPQVAQEGERFPREAGKRPHCLGASDYLGHFVLLGFCFGYGTRSKECKKSISYAF